MFKPHAKFSASGSSKWFLCAGSLNAEEGIPNNTSPYAQEGTAAHELAELCLTQGGNCFDWVDVRLPDTNAITVTNEMASYVQQYVDFVKSKKGEVLIEVQVDFSHIAPEGFGTCDSLVFAGDALHVIDLKYGKGVRVSAEENTQGILYALGAVNDYGAIYAFKTVTITIVQPRLDHVSEWTISVDELNAWGERLKQAAEYALLPDASRTAGEKQCQFCRAKSSCEIAFKKPAKYKVEEIDANIFDTF